MSSLQTSEWESSFCAFEERFEGCWLLRILEKEGFFVLHDTNPNMRISQIRCYRERVETAVAVFYALTHDISPSAKLNEILFISAMESLLLDDAFCMSSTVQAWLTEPNLERYEDHGPERRAAEYWKPLFRIATACTMHSEIMELKHFVCLLLWLADGLVHVLPPLKPVIESVLEILAFVEVCSKRPCPDVFHGFKGKVASDFKVVEVSQPSLRFCRFKAGESSPGSRRNICLDTCEAGVSPYLLLDSTTGKPRERILIKKQKVEMHWKTLVAHWFQQQQKREVELADSPYG